MTGRNPLIGITAVKKCIYIRVGKFKAFFLPLIPDVRAAIGQF